VATGEQEQNRMKTLFQSKSMGDQEVAVVRLNGQRYAGLEQAEPQDETEPLVRLFEQIACEQSWQPGQGLRSHQPVSLYLALTVAGELAGGLQAVPGLLADPLPYRVVWPEVNTPDLAATAHVTMLALARQYRGRPSLFWLLCVELWRWCHAGNIHTLFLEATPATMRVCQRMGWPLEIVGELRLHWGEDCYLCCTDIRQMEKEISRRASRSARYHAFLEQAHRK
jgi:hypothetical protein